MAEEKKTVHQYKLSAKSDPEKEELVIWVSDNITKKRWESSFSKNKLGGKEIKEVFEIIKKAVSNKPPTWAATYPQQEGADLYIDIEDGTFEFELPEVEFDENDIF